MNQFFRFPHTPHLEWLAAGSPRGDKVLDISDIKYLLEKNVTVEEKLDGANLGISMTENGQLQVQNRGQYLHPPFTGQFSRLTGWLMQHGRRIQEKLTPDRIIFGEWCAARHSLEYTDLPDWLLLFDIYEKKESKFWSCIKRNALASDIGIKTVPCLYSGHIEIEQLKKILLTENSKYRNGKIEGLIIRRDSLDWCEGKAKLVHPDFSQSIEEHWRSRAIEWNKIYNPY